MLQRRAQVERHHPAWPFIPINWVCLRTLRWCN